MKSSLLTLIALLTTSQHEYLAYKIHYYAEESNNIVVVPKENFYSHAAYLYDHFNMDAIAYNVKSPVTNIVSYCFIDSFEELNERGEETWMSL